MDKTKIELMDGKFIDNKSFFKTYGNIIISKQEIKNLT